MEFDLEHIFTYHNSKEKIPNFNAIRDAAKHFAQVVLDNTPSCDDQNNAITKIREAVASSNAAIALSGRLHK
jgi:hypothetical protein